MGEKKKKNRHHVFPISLEVAVLFSKGWCPCKAYVMLSELDAVKISKK
jgi:hypothetical protein